MQEKTNRLIQQLRPFLPNDDAYGRLYADIHDLVEISAWFLAKMNSNADKTLGPAEIEDFLIELDVNFIDHGLFHLQSLKAEIKSALKNLPDHADGGKNLRGVA